MIRILAEITANENIAASLFLMRVKAPEIAQKWIAGQFVHVLPPVRGKRPEMLRRPISILASTENEIEFVYRVVGDGTALLSEMKEGEELDIIGPLGNGFDSIPSRSGVHILIAGGVGAPPIIALARNLKSLGKEVELFQGAKTSSDLILHQQLLSESFKYSVSTEDGSVGHKGYVTEILPEPSAKIAALYACGPIGMLYALYKWRGKTGFPYLVSMENKMGCGVGVCLGCSIPTTNDYYIKTCKNGPVFDADLVDWKKMR